MSTPPPAGPVQRVGPESIPVELDISGILADLNRWGWRDFKVETVCGFSSGYVAQIKCGNVRMMAYQRAARLYNFWSSEREINEPAVPPAALQTQAQAVTT